jgi:hypothetical protein
MRSLARLDSLDRFTRTRARVMLSVFALAATSLVSAHAAAETLDSEDQAAQDVTPVPAGMGSIMVPSLTRAADEPDVVVYHRGERIASGPTGSRIALPPGTYRVVLGSADPQTADLPSTEVRVRAGKTEVIKPFFGALRVNIVNDEGEPAEGEYIVKSADRGAVYGPVTMQVGAGAKPVPTWLLPPGKYYVINGHSPKATEGSVAVTVVAGDATRYRLVVSEDRLLRTEFGDDPVQKTKSIWRVRWLLGASGTVSRRVGTLTGTQGDAVFVNAFSRFEGGINTHMHDAALRLNLDQSFIGVETANGEAVPIRSLTNEVEGELLYNLRLGGIFGPYARGLARTSLLKTQYRPETDVVVQLSDEAGNALGSQNIGRGFAFNMLDSFAPLTFQEGLGLGITVFDNRTLTLQVRGGGALRQSFYDGGFYFRNRVGNTVGMTRLDDQSSVGGELTAIGGVRLGNIVSWETRFDSFVDAKQVFKEGQRFLPVFRWDNTVAFRFHQYFSAIYSLSVRRDELVLSDLQTAQLLALRAQYSVF